MKLSNKIKLLTFTLLCSISTFAQIKTSKLETNKIPTDIKFEGKVKNALTWEDESGKNIVITTETGEFKDENSEYEDSRCAKIFAYHFVISDKKTKLLWKIEDGIDDCPVDIAANFIKNTLTVTDLNNDGKTEVWIMYKTACHGDVSPCSMKVIMYENGKKFAMRGENKVVLSETETYGGKYTFDKAFKNAPKEFRTYAEKMWKKNILETWGN